MKNKIIFKTLMLKGEAGSTIVSMEKTGHVGTADIYTITFNDGSTTEISLENMSAITSVEKTSSTDTEDIYTITCADGSTQTFSVLNHNADIAAMSDDIDTIDARVDNFINSVVPNTVETLWTGSIKDVGDSATLSKAVSNFDYIDLYLLGSADSKYIRVPATQTELQIQQQNLSDDASSNFLRLWEMGVSISGSTVSITKSIAWAWDDPNNSNPTVTANAQNSIPITRIDGVKVASDTPAELTDIRVGADGKTYYSAGAAVRGQISDVKSSLTNEEARAKAEEERLEELFAAPTQEAVDKWLDDHPEATTTVQDGAITNAKIVDGTITRNKFDENVNVLLDGHGVKKVDIGLVNWAQDASVYNGKVFAVGTSTGVLKVYDFATKELIASSTLSGDIKPHGNAVSFGKKLNAADTYPLFYVSGYNGLDANGNTLSRGTCCVYKILDNYATQFVQEIHIDFADDALWLGTETYDEAVRYGDYIVDTDNDRLYLVTSLCENHLLKTRLFEFNIPSTNSNSVILTQTDILNYYDLPFYPYLQGAEYYNNKLYISFGMTSDNAGLAVIDLNTHAQLGCIALGDIMEEPEAVIQVDGNIFVAKNNFYKLSAIPFESNIGDLTQLKTFKNKTIVDAINSIHDVEDFSDKVTNKPDLFNGKFLRCGKLVTISYQGNSAAHTHQQVLFTLPEGYRPVYLEYITAVKGGSAMTIRINNTTGEATIWNDPSTLSSTGRIYFSHTYICDR